MTEPRTAPEPIARPVRALLEVFDDALADVRFPDVDAERLHAMAENVRERADAVQAAQAALAEAEAALAEEKLRMDQLAQRALSYARIYAEAHPELAARLAAIELGGAPAPVAKKRGRPRKSERAEAAPSVPSAVLPFDEDGGDAHAAELM